MNAPFIHQRKIRFSHCDPAGILYFPHVFDFLNAALEDWFETGLRMPFGESHIMVGGRTVFDAREERAGRK